MVKKILVLSLVLAAFASATILDGVSGLGFGSNAARTAVLKDKKRVDAGVTVKNDISRVRDGETKPAHTVRDFSNSPWVSWTDGLGSGFYKVSLGVDSWRYFDNDINNNALSLEYAQNFGGIIGGIGVDFDNKSTSWKDVELGKRKTKSSSRVGYNLGLAKVIDSKQTVLFGYQTGPGYTVSTTAKGIKAAKEDFTQNTNIGAGYIYTVSNALQLGVQAVSTWREEFDTTKTFGVAVSYLPIKALELQVYLNRTDGVGGQHGEDKYHKGRNLDVAGADLTNYGLIATYDLGKSAGILGAGVDVTDSIVRDANMITYEDGVAKETTGNTIKGKNVVGTISYTLFF